MGELSVLIVDDEPNAVRGLSHILNKRNDVRVVGTTSSGLEAVALVEELQPKVVLLDIQMPGMSGFDVVASIGKENIPFLIFVTAHQDFAIQAFEVHAFDYILKPVDHNRLFESLDRVHQQQISNIRSSTRLQSLLTTISAGETKPTTTSDRLAIKSQGNVVLAYVHQISRIESAGNYVRYFVDGEVYLSRATMNEVQKQLSMTALVRVHRSNIVNVDRVKKIAACPNGEFEIMLDDGATVTTGKSYRDTVRRIMNS